MKTFYRVCSPETEQGLWYDYKGKFTGLIHDRFKFCKNSDLKMDFDPELVGWLSAVENLDDLYQWFTIEDIKALQECGWYIHEYESSDWQFYDRFQHLIINQFSSRPTKKIILL
jgi:hypothetical protein